MKKPTTNKVWFWSETLEALGYTQKELQYFTEPGDDYYRERGVNFWGYEKLPLWIGRCGCFNNNPAGFIICARPHSTTLCRNYLFIGSRRDVVDYVRTHKAEFNGYSYIYFQDVGPANHGLMAGPFNVDTVTDEELYYDSATKENWKKYLTD